MRLTIIAATGEAGRELLEQAEQQRQHEIAHECAHDRRPITQSASRASWIATGSPGSAACRSKSEGTQTIISGLLPDQPALYGLLAKIRDLGLCLISVRQLDPDEPGKRTSGEIPAA